MAHRQRRSRWDLPKGERYGFRTPSPSRLRRARQAETASHIKQASGCREKAQSDPAQHDYWIDEAVVWLQRAIETRYSNAVTHEIRIRVPKTAK